jgi:hypothetical protein
MTGGFYKAGALPAVLFNIMDMASITVFYFAGFSLFYWWKNQLDLII